MTAGVRGRIFALTSGGVMATGDKGFTPTERNVILALTDYISRQLHHAAGCPVNDGDPRPVFPVPKGYMVGRLASWGCWLNWCPVEGHLWTSVDSAPAQYGDGVSACFDHDGLPNSSSPEPQYHQ